MTTITRSTKDWVVGISALGLVAILALGLLALAGWFLVSLIENEWAYLAPAVGIALVALVGLGIKNATRH